MPWGHLSNSLTAFQGLPIPLFFLEEVSCRGLTVVFKSHFFLPVSTVRPWRNMTPFVGQRRRHLYPSPVPLSSNPRGSCAAAPQPASPAPWQGLTGRLSGVPRCPESPGAAGSGAAAPRSPGRARPAARRWTAPPGTRPRPRRRAKAAPPGRAEGRSGLSGTTASGIAGQGRCRRLEVGQASPGPRQGTGAGQGEGSAGGGEFCFFVGFPVRCHFRWGGRSVSGYSCGFFTKIASNPLHAFRKEPSRLLRSALGKWLLSMSSLLIF